MAKYIVTGGPIEHGMPEKTAKIFQIGSEIDLSPAEADALLALGEIIEVIEAAAKGRKSKQTEGDEGSQE